MRCRIGPVLFFLLIVSSAKLLAQTDTIHSAGVPAKSYLTNSSFRTWSIGVSGGILTPYTLIGYNSRQDFTSPNVGWGYSVYFKDQLSKSFGLQGDLMAGKLTADHSYEKFPNGEFIYTQSDIKLHWSASLSGNFTIVHLGIVQPYVTLGGGVISYLPVVHAYYPTETVPTFSTLSSFFVPLGLGLKFNITKGVNIDLGYKVNFVMTDNFDGYNYGPTNDRFSYTHIGLEFALGQKSKKQLAAQLITIPVQNRILVHDQTLLDALQELQSKLAAQTDKNVQMKNELDAANANVTRLTTDSDGDGIPDVYDKCPNTPPNTKVDASGCPLATNVVTGAKSELTDEEKRSLAAAASNIEFYSGTEIISGRSFASLNLIIRMMEDKKFSLKIDVYANRNVSSDGDLRLAQLRAESVKNYLVNKGANASKIETASHRGFPPDLSASKRRGVANLGQVELTVVQ